MTTLDALYSRQVPARGAAGGDDAIRSSGPGARAGRGQDGFAAALNGQAKGARDGGRSPGSPDDDPSTTGAEMVDDPAGPEVEGDPDAAYALLVSLFEEIRATVAKPEEAKAESGEPAIGDAAAVDALIAAINGEGAAGGAATVTAGLTGEQATRAGDPDATVPVAGRKAVTGAAAIEPALDGKIAAGDATVPQAVTADAAAARLRAIASTGEAETGAARPDALGAAAASVDAKAETPARQPVQGRAADGIADVVRAAAQSSSGGDAGSGTSGGEGRRNSGGAGSWAARAGAASTVVENVRTVESRSHAAPSVAGNAEAVIRSLAQAGETLDLRNTLAIVSGAASAQPATGANADLHLTRPQMLHTLKIQLNPLELGQVTAVMRLTGEELSVELRVETPEAYRQLSSDSESIVRSLRAQGYGVDQVTVMQAGSDRSSTGGQGGQQQTYTSGQQFQSGSGQGSDGAGGSGEGRRGEGSRNGNQQGNMAHETAAPLHGGTGSSDGVYL